MSLILVIPSHHSIVGSVLSGGSLCHPTPCHSGGTCETHDGVFTCYCPPGFAGSLCQHDLSKSSNLQVPSFSGNDSLMAVITPDDAVNRIEVEIEFRTFADDGVIVYSGANGGAEQDDFMSISVIDG
jgi:hypothetical protein